MTIKQELETHAAACRTARREGRPLPVWCGGSLTGADLRGAYLRGADLTYTDLRGADLSGADLRGANLRGADLTGADLRGAYLRGADLTYSDLRGANLRGVLIPEGAVSTHAAGEDGGYHWHALRLQDGVVVLQYGCERHPLATWQARGPAYGAKHGHYETHWAIGPAIAIAAAEALITKPASTDVKEP